MYSGWLGREGRWRRDEGFSGLSMVIGQQLENMLVWPNFRDLKRCWIKATSHPLTLSLSNQYQRFDARFSPTKVTRVYRVVLCAVADL